MLEVFEREGGREIREIREIREFREFKEFREFRELENLGKNFVEKYLQEKRHTHETR